MTDLGILHQILDALKSLQQGQAELQKGQAETNVRLDKIEGRLDKVDGRLDKIETELTETSGFVKGIILHQSEDFELLKEVNDKVTSLSQTTEAHGQKLKAL